MLVGIAEREREREREREAYSRELTICTAVLIGPPGLSAHVPFVGEN